MESFLYEDFLNILNLLQNYQSLHTKEFVYLFIEKYENYFKNQFILPNFID